MIGRSRQPEDYRSVLDPRRVRRTRLTRAGIAVALIGILLVVVWRLDGEADEVPEPPMVPDLADVTPEVTPEPPPFSIPAPFGPDAPDAPVVEVPLPDEVARIEVRDVPAAASAGESSADSEASDDTAAVSGARSVADKAVGEGSAPAAKPPVQRRTTSSAPADSGVRYQVRFDDFGDLALANSLRRSLADAGQASQVQQRVAVGPFPTGRAAGEALARLDKERGIRGIVIGGLEPGEWMVQVGVFADAGNADSLRRRLAEREYPVVVHGRVVIGPFRGREAVDEALAKLRAAGTPVSGAQVIALP